MNYRQSQFGEGWEQDWINWGTPYAYAKEVDGVGFGGRGSVLRWEIVQTAPYTLDGLRALVRRWNAEGRIGAVIYDGHRVGFPVPWVRGALKGNAKHAPNHSRGAEFGESRLAFDHASDNPEFGFDHSNDPACVALPAGAYEFPKTKGTA